MEDTVKRFNQEVTILRADIQKLRTQNNALKKQIQCMNKKIMLLTNELAKSAASDTAIVYLKQECVDY